MSTAIMEVVEPSPLERTLSRGRVRGPAMMFGPAFVAAIAYVDPGNYATNVAAGARHGYLLVWVVISANLLAMVIQVLSAKLGIASGRSLPELCRDSFPRPAVRMLWVQAEIVAMATDLAELLGAAIALNLLFDVPLIVGGLISAVVAFALLALQSRGFRRFELAVGGLLAMVVVAIGYDVAIAGVDPGGLASGLVPRLAGNSSLLIATGIVGATVMPHVIYLHSDLMAGRVRPQSVAEQRRLLRFERADITVALGIAGLVNVALLVIAAQLFHGGTGPAVDSLDGVHSALRTTVGSGAAVAFAVALLASGLAASGVGTFAGQVVMAGFLRRRIPLLLRRAITILPAMLVLAVHWDPSTVLVVSQVVLSFGIPFALIPLVILTGRRSVMGELVNTARTCVLAWGIAAVLVALNVVLLVVQWRG